MMEKIKDTLIKIVIVGLIVIVTLLAVWPKFNNALNAIDEGVIVDKYPERYNGHVTWMITIEGHKDGEDETVQYSFPVPESEYVEYKINDYYKKH